MSITIMKNDASAEADEIVQRNCLHAQEQGVKW
jgi:hypothetical protein